MVRKNTIEYFKKQKEFKRRFDFEKFNVYKTFDFLKVNVGNITCIDELTNNQLAFIARLVLYVPYNGGALCHRNGKPLDKQQILEICNVSETTYKRILGALSKKNIMKSVRNDNTKKNEYYLNPQLFMRGVKIDKNVAKMFK